MLSASIPSYDDDKKEDETAKGKEQKAPAAPVEMKTAEQVKDFFNF